MSKYFLFLGIIDTLNEWNEKLNEFTASHVDNVFTGTVVIAIIVAVAFFAISSLSKK